MSQLKETIEIVQNENGVCVAHFSSDEFNQTIGEGENLEEAVKNLLFNVKTSLLETDEERTEAYMKEVFPAVREIATNTFSIMGPENFSLHQFKQKMKLDKENSLLRLNYLKSFGFAKKVDDKLWKIIVEYDDLIVYYHNESEKWKATHKYYENLSEQMKLMKQEQQIKA